jgi:hypothetical protein
VKKCINQVVFNRRLTVNKPSPILCKIPVYFDSFFRKQLLICAVQSQCNMTDFDILIEELHKFRDARDWGRGLFSFVLPLEKQRKDIKRINLFF